MNELRPIQIILLGFFITIFAGSILLTLPIAAKSGQATPYIDALFTATTSVCVTGLVVETTMTHWSLFGQVVILLLVQIGGLGVVTITTGMFYVLGRRITLGNRMLIQESLGLNTLTGLVPLVKKIILGTAIVEGAGAVLYATQFIPEFGVGYGIWAAVFNSISAFCNAGMDIVKEDSFRSYVTNPVIYCMERSLAEYEKAYKREDSSKKNCATVEISNKDRVSNINIPYFIWNSLDLFV